MSDTNQMELDQQIDRVASLEENRSGMDWEIGIYRSERDRIGGHTTEGVK